MQTDHLSSFLILLAFSLSLIILLFFFVACSLLLFFLWRINIWRVTLFVCSSLSLFHAEQVRTSVTIQEDYHREKAFLFSPVSSLLPEEFSSVRRRIKLFSSFRDLKWRTQTSFQSKMILSDQSMWTISEIFKIYLKFSLGNTLFVELQVKWWVDQR